MVALAPIINETPTWDVLDTSPKLHSRAREAKTTTCAEAPRSTSFGRVEIWQAIYDDRDGLESFTRDPIGFVGRSVNLYQYVRGRATRFVDPAGLWQIAPDGDPIVRPPYTNCIGYCVHPTEDYVMPSTTIQKMLDFFKLECDSKAGSGEDCLAKCRENLKNGGQGCSQLLVYIVNIDPAVTRRVKEILEELREARNQEDYAFLLNELWDLMAENLGKLGGSGQDPIDIHMSKCNPKFPYEYEMQMGSCKKQSPKDVTEYFFPTPAEPEVIDTSRILFKTCCCKGKAGGQQNSLPFK